MRRVLGLIGLALAVPWVACDDRTVTLAEGQKASLSSSGGTGGSTSSVSSATFGSTSTSQSASGGSPNLGPTGFATHGVMGTTAPHPFGAGGDSDSDGNSDRGDNSGGSGGLPIGGISTNAGNEGGQGPECQDPDCLTCAYARGYCNLPTPDCADSDDWLRKCDSCGQQCPVGLTCFQDFKCRVSCFGGGGCGPGEYCDPEFSACVYCVEDEHCPEGKLCLSGECVECRTKSDCSAADRPYCIAGACRECLSPADCNGGFCNALNRCAECFTDDNCNEAEPFCNAGACSECRMNEDCEQDEVCDTFGCSPRN